MTRKTKAQQIIQTIKKYNLINSGLNGISSVSLSYTFLPSTKVALTLKSSSTTTASKSLFKDNDPLVFKPYFLAALAELIFTTSSIFIPVFKS